MCWQGVPTRVGCWNKTIAGEQVRGEDLWDPLEMRAEGEGRLQLVFYCRAGDETVRLNLEEQRSVSLLASLA